MSGAFVIKRAVDGRYLFNLKAGNGEIILTSGVYTTRDAAFDGITAVRTNAASDKQFERKMSTDKKPYFVLKAANGEVLGRSETYSSNTSMEHGIQSVMKNAPEAEVKDLSIVEPAPVHA